MSRNGGSLVVLVAASVAFCGVMSTGCGGDPEPPVAWKQSKELPEDFPADIPIYPKAEVHAVVSGRGSVIMWETADPLPVVQEYYTKALEEKGFRVTAYPGVPSPWMGDGGVMVNGSAWGKQLGFALGERGTGTLITFVLRP